jgi:phospholipase/carboxylesterase
MVLTASRDTLLYVPQGYRPDRLAPLVVLLHGAGGDAEGGLALLQEQADDAGLILVAPASRGPTWDILMQGVFGRDVALIDAALDRVFARYAVDPARIAVGGFSDGASYALSLGITNGDLFTHVIAFSPGFIAAFERTGSPRVFISHGTQDRVLPIDQCSRKIAPRLQKDGYDLRYIEFEGPHTVPQEMRREAVAWLTHD